MSRLILSIASFLLVVCPLRSVRAQQNSAPAAVVPNVTRFSGTLTDLNGKPLTGVTGITFSLYKDEEGGPPLWMETQNVAPDKNGRYWVVLGSTTAQGLPAGLFTSGEARWMAVRAEGQNENARVLLVSVPYALKAADAETVGGFPASAFMRATEGGATASVSTSTASSTKAAKSATITGSGTTNFLPLWLSASNLGNSKLFQSTAGNFGVGTTTPGFALDVKGRINASNGFNLGGAAFAIGSTSLQNAFVGYSGNTTTTGIQNAANGSKALAALTSGSTNTAMGALALTANTKGQGNTAVGNSTLLSNLTGLANTAVGYESLFSNSSGSFNSAVGDLALSTTFSGNYNIGVGYSAGSVVGGAGATGSNNTFVGAYSGPGDLANLSNATAIGYSAVVSENNALVLGMPGTMVGIGTSTPATPLTIQGDDNAQPRGVPHQLQIQGASNPNKQLLIGYFADALSDTGYGSIQATDSGVQNTWLALNPQGAPVLIGEPASSFSNLLQVAQGRGPAVADGWATYSSRRWKTNIETLHGALSKVERLRGVSYDLKSNGKHEIGVIAEEVGAVVPEIVEWDKNGKDAEGVDYSRMVALLIEGMKEQQAITHNQQSQIRAQQKVMKVQQTQITRLLSHVKAIEGSLNLGQQAAAEVRTSTNIR